MQEKFKELIYNQGDFREVHKRLRMLKDDIFFFNRKYGNVQEDGGEKEINSR